ncbi:MULTISPECIES: 2-keto-3-deoxygluconate kinase [Paenibacillus]|uniref:2-keto-3-deoxygluconate kinase n=1 Tax=Paenibacillus TaxID=44249 RepID=UPI0020C9DA51|nr:2-keto-3-deoxygluconate kinase [Paenibacillus odorifer]
MCEGHIDKHGYNEHREYGEHGEMNINGVKEGSEHPHKSAQTFRRARAIAFLDKLMINRSALQQQLKESEIETTKQVISGELKATEAIIDEFINMFQIHEITSDNREDRT